MFCTGCPHEVSWQPSDIPRDPLKVRVSACALRIGHAHWACAWGMRIGHAHGACARVMRMGHAHGACAWGMRMGSAHGACAWGLRTGHAQTGSAWGSRARLSNAALETPRAEPHIVANSFPTLIRGDPYDFRSLPAVGFGGPPAAAARSGLR